MPKSSQTGTTYVTSLNGKDLYNGAACLGFSQQEIEGLYAEKGQCSKSYLFCSSIRQADHANSMSSPDFYHTTCLRKRIGRKDDYRPRRYTNFSRMMNTSK